MQAMIGAALSLLVQGAEEPAAREPSSGLGGSFLVPMLVIFGIFYFVLIMPERRKQKQRQALLGGLKKGDRVMTSGGIYGSVAQIQEDVVTLQVADGVRMRFNRVAVQNILSTDETPARGAAETDGKA
jgi:preprotein translocase subunit YajC